MNIKGIVLNTYNPMIISLLGIRKVEPYDKTNGEYRLTIEYDNGGIIDCSYSNFVKGKEMRDIDMKRILSAMNGVLFEEVAE